MNSREVDPVIDVVELEKVGDEYDHTREVDKGNEKLNSYVKNAIGEAVIDEILFVKEKVNGELKLFAFLISGCW